MHKIIRFIIQIVAAVFGGLAIIFAIASWRLSSGPISIAFLSPYIVEAFEEEDLSYRFEFEDTILTWAGWNRSLDIVVTDARAIGPDGEILASVPEISLELSALSLLKGKLRRPASNCFGPRFILFETCKASWNSPSARISQNPTRPSTSWWRIFWRRQERIIRLAN